ncbi:putative AP2/B3-like transcriptional factor family protein [Quillaja saponaria]|uniref:AP2/B3-like transcriptional factor family protein n=1 Tax=Quillaja saponaria TaxID=32244 RepID=A0AAD7PUI2_QUISA|nr:putative AP2/B3-like transcriptional factor family protein [Quillaja saponaria]
MSTNIILFEKMLSSTDVEQGLQFPTSHQENHLPQIVEGCNYVDFDLKYGNEQKKHTFRCRIRNGIHDLYNKPVISKGWRQVARDKGFQKGDKLIFYKVQGNRCADVLAKLGSISTQDFTGLTEPPQEVVTVLRDEKEGLSFPGLSSMDSG